MDMSKGVDVAKLPVVKIVPEEYVYGGVRTEDSGYVAICPHCGAVWEWNDDFEILEEIGGVQIFRCRKCGGISRSQ